MILELTQQEGTKSWHQSVVKHKDNIFDTFIEGTIYIYILRNNNQPSSIILHRKMCTEFDQSLIYNAFEVFASKSLELNKLEPFFLTSWYYETSIHS